MTSRGSSDAAAPANAVAKQAAESAEARPARFSPEHEKELLQESTERKARANELFNMGDCSAALVQYEQALLSCPDYKHFERAVLHSNTSACLIKLEDWTAAAKAATSSLDALVVMERELGLISESKSSLAQRMNENSKDISKDNERTIATNSGAEADGQKLEGADPAEPALAPLNVPNATKNDIKRIRIKALLRRGRARAEAGGWSNLSGAEEDYKTLSQIPGLTAADAKTVRAQLIAVPPMTKAAQEKEMSEMWGKLRTLGDGILKPFGLSTNNFQMVKDETTGGYSMNFHGSQGQ